MIFPDVEAALVSKLGAAFPSIRFSAKLTGEPRQVAIEFLPGREHDTLHDGMIRLRFRHETRAKAYSLGQRVIAWLTSPRYGIDGNPIIYCVRNTGPTKEVDSTRDHIYFAVLDITVRGEQIGENDGS